MALSVYMLAVFHRTSLGVAGLLAADRFDISAGQLSTFTVVQLAVYAAMQVPVGVLLDRFGSKRIMTIGLVLMTAGQAWFALAGSFPVGLLARVLIGAGDAMIFTCLLRLIALWFRVRQAPVVTQITGMLGQLGAVAATTPLSIALREWGWERAFGSAAAMGVVLGIGLLVIVKDSPYTGESVERIKIRALTRSLAEIWDNPGTRLALWVHFTAPFGATVFIMLWGFPFLTAGQGLSAAAAGNLLILMTATAMVAAPLMGVFTARLPFRRSQFVMALVLLIILMWTVVLVWPGRAPLWLLILFVVVLAAGGPGSMVGFDLARSFHPPERLGRASGVINVGGFVASLASIGLIGLILDHLAPGGPATYTLADYKIAMSVQYLFWVVGVIQLVRYRRKGLALILEHPGALDALRNGQALLPGMSRDPEDR